MTLLTRNKHFLRLHALLAVAAFSLATTGCRYNRCGSIYNECIETCLAQHRAKHRANQAWECSQSRCASVHVRDGFVDGYCAVALGSKGCTPAVAPSKYWGWRYSGPEGQMAGAQWLQGYPMGAAAARSDGSAYRVASLNIPSQEQYEASTRGMYTGQTISQEPLPSGTMFNNDTIDSTIDFVPRDYEGDPSNGVEAIEAPAEAIEDAVEGAADAIEDAAAITSPIRQITQKTVLKEAVTTPAAKTVVEQVPEFTLEANDEVFGFGIE